MAGNAKYGKRLTRKDLDAIFEEYYPKLFNYVYYRTLNRDLADDITASAMLKLVRSYESFDSERGEFGAWIYRIARNELYSYYRRQRDEADLDSVPESLVACTDDYGNLDDKGAMVRAALEALNEEERELVYLKYWEELPNKEIAQRMGMNSSTISTKLWRATDKMRKAVPQL